jgi:hypothetical protein
MSSTKRKRSHTGRKRGYRPSRNGARRAGGTRRNGRGTAEPDWVGLSSEDLLDVRMCDLGVRIEGTPLERRVERLYKELERREILFRPHCWLSDEWFSPDGVPGIAIPFYLAHPRLARLEREQILEVEGGTEDWCLRILRHETGHALDTAYQLHRRRTWRETFGKFSEAYPDYYNPQPYSRRYVLHLDQWYAQSHPAEDFAETFAVWLKPRSGWRTHYRGWPAMKKLEYVDRVVSGLKNSKPKVTTRRHASPLREMRKTLRKHYEEKRARYGLEHPDFHDRDLRKLFSDAPEHAKRPPAAGFLRRIRPELRRMVARWTGTYQYMIDQLLDEMIQRCRELDLRLDRPESQARRDALVMLTVQTMNYLHDGHHRIAL